MIRQILSYAYLGMGNAATLSDVSESRLLN